MSGAIPYPFLKDITATEKSIHPEDAVEAGAGGVGVGDTGGEIGGGEDGAEIEREGNSDEEAGDSIEPTSAGLRRRMRLRK